MTDPCRQCANYLAEIRRLQAVNKGYYDNLSRLMKPPSRKSPYWPETTLRIRAALSIPPAQAAVLDVLYHDPQPIDTHDLTKRMHPDRPYYHDHKVCVVHISLMNGRFRSNPGQLVANLRGQGYVLTDVGRDLLDKIFK